MRKAVRVIAAVTLLAVALSGSTALAAQRGTNHRASRHTSVFARFIIWINSRLSPPIGVTEPEPEGRVSPPVGATLPSP
jgi:hypothetical protein